MTAPTRRTPIPRSRPPAAHAGSDHTGRSREAGSAQPARTLANFTAGELRSSWHIGFSRYVAPVSEPAWSRRSTRITRSPVEKAPCSSRESRVSEQGRTAFRGGTRATIMTRISHRLRERSPYRILDRRNLRCLSGCAGNGLLAGLVTFPRREFQTAPPARVPSGSHAIGRPRHRVPRFRGNTVSWNEIVRDAVVRNTTVRNAVGRERRWPERREDGRSTRSPRGRADTSGGRSANARSRPTGAVRAARGALLSRHHGPTSARSGQPRTATAKRPRRQRRRIRPASTEHCPLRTTISS